MKQRTIIFAGITLFVLIIIYFLFIKPNMNTISSNVDASHKNSTQPYKTNIFKRTFASGKIMPLKEVEIKSQISGIIDKLYVKIGQKVKKGDKLAIIRLIPNPENINNAETSLKKAEISLQQITKEYKRQERLFKDSVIALSEFEKIQKDLDLQQESVISAKNQLKILIEGFANSSSEQTNIITSTLDGTILEVKIKEGSSVTGKSNFHEGTIIMIIADMNELTFEGSISESEVGYLKQGMNLSLTIGAIHNKTFNATLETISPKGNEVQGSIRFNITAKVLSNDEHVIRAGYSAKAEIILNQRDSVYAINERDVIFTTDSAFVELMSPDNSFTKKYVELGLSDGINIEILSGIIPTDRIKIQQITNDEESVKVSFSSK